jgi:hypothetical protein
MASNRRYLKSIVPEPKNFSSAKSSGRIDSIRPPLFVGAKTRLFCVSSRVI